MLKKLHRWPILFLSVYLLSAVEVSDAKTADETNTITVYKAAGPSVVNISSMVVRYDFFYRPIPQKGMGSGVVIDEKGYIITNSHVVQNAQSLEVTFTDGTLRPAILVGAEPDNDLAVIKVDSPDRKLTALTMGSSRGLAVGQKVLAIGNPFGLGQTLITGIISSVGRSIRSGNGAVMRNVIQTDAAINPGNSGGPLLNSDGELIGLNTAIIGPTGTNTGVGFAIPVDTLKKAVPPLISGKFSYYGIGPLLFFGLVLAVAYLFWRILHGRRRDSAT